MRVALGRRWLGEASQPVGCGGFRDVEDDQTQVPVRQIRRSSILAKCDAVQERLRHAPATGWRALAACADREPGIALRAPVGNLDRLTWIADVDHPQVAATVD